MFLKKDGIKYPSQGYRFISSYDTNNFKKSIITNVVVRVDNEYGFEDDGVANQHIRCYFKILNGAQESFLKEKNINYLNFFTYLVSRAASAYLEKIGSKDREAFRVLYYYIPGENFFSVSILMKYSSQKIIAVNMKKFMNDALAAFGLYPFLINGYKAHEGSANSVWDIYHMKSFPIFDVKGKELNNIIGDTDNKYKDSFSFYSQNLIKFSENLNLQVLKALDKADIVILEKQKIERELENQSFENLTVSSNDSRDKLFGVPRVNKSKKSKLNNGAGGPSV